MRVILHGLSDDVRDLGVGPVVNLVHCMKDTPLHRLQPINDVRHSPIEDCVGRIVQIPVLEHSGQFEMPAILPEKFVKLPGGLPLGHLGVVIRKLGFLSVSVHRHVFAFLVRRGHFSGIIVPEFFVLRRFQIVLLAHSQLFIYHS